MSEGETVENNKTIVAYKGFDSDWTCRGFAYEVGKTYTHDGVVRLCGSGFHACESPLDILRYYPPTGQMAEVELADVSNATDGEDSKRVAKSITIKAALTIAGLVSAAIEYTAKRCEPANASHSEGYQSASSATGDWSASSATGNRSASSATGNWSASSATGEDAVAAAFGLESKAMAGKGGVVIVAWHDGTRKRLTVGYVGDGLDADTWYCCDESGKLVPA